MRSTTQRQRPTRSRDSCPRRAMRGAMPRHAGAAGRGRTESHTPCRHVACPADSAVVPPARPRPATRPPADRASCSHTDWPATVAPPAANRADQPTRDACSRICLDRSDWARCRYRRGGEGTLAESRLARSQAIWSCSRMRCNRVRCKRSQTPARCQSRRRRQQLMPQPQPISGGRSSHWIPVFKTNKMPVSAARSGMRGRPPRADGRCTGSQGTMTAHTQVIGQDRLGQGNTPCAEHAFDHDQGLAFDSIEYC